MNKTLARDLQRLNKVIENYKQQTEEFVEGRRITTLALERLEELVRRGIWTRARRILNTLRDQYDTFLVPRRLLKTILRNIEKEQPR